MQVTTQTLMTLLTVALLGAAVLLTGCSSDSAAERMAQATKYIKSGELRSATIELKNILQKQPDNAQAWLTLGKISLTNGQYADAVHQLRSARKQGSTAADVDVLLAQASLGEGDYQAALDVLQPDAAANAQARAQTYVLRGRAYLGLNDAQQAKQAFAAALSAQPNDAAALVGQARLAIMENDDARARQLVAKATAADPDYGRAWVVANNLAFRQGRCDDAIAAFQHIETLPANTLAPALTFHARAQAAHCQLQLGQMQQAAVNIDALLATAPKHPYANYLKGLEAYLNKDYETATTHAQQALAVAPDNVSSLILLGMVKAAQGDLKGAQAQFTNAVKQAPDNLRARQLLASVYTQRDLPKQAVQVLQAALDRHGSNPRVLAQLGEASVRAGARDRGLQYLQSSARQSTDNPAMQLALARQMAVAGSTDDALALLGNIQTDGAADQLKLQLLQIGLYLKDGQADKAIAAAQALVQQHPDDTKFVRVLARVYAAAGDQAKARTTLEDALATTSDKAAVRLDLGELTAAQGDYPAADVIFKDVLKAHPDNLRAVLALAHSAQRQGQAKQAIDWFKQGAQLQPDNTDIKVTLARAYLQQKQPEQALAIAEKLVAAAPDNGRLYWLQAVAQAAAQQDKAALTSMQKAVELAPDVLKIHFDLVRMMLAQDDLVSATSELRQIRDQHPDSVRAAVMLARTLVRQGQLQAALATADSLRDGGSHIASSYALRAELLQGNADYEGAAAAYAKAYAARPVRALAMRLFDVRRKGDLPHPAQSLLAWLEQHPGDARVKAALAQWYQVSGNHAAAVEQYQALLEAHPSSAAALNNLALIYLQQGDDRALQLAERAHEIAPDNAAILDTLGWILVRGGHVDRGLPLLRQALQSASAPAMQYHLAVALAATGNSDDRTEAVTLLQQLLATKQEFPSRAEAQQLLQKLGN